MDLRKEKTVMYLYFFSVVALIASFSFTVEGNKISGAAVFDDLKGYVSGFDVFSVSLILFIFLSLLVFSLYFVHHSHKIRKDIHHSHVKLISVLTVLIVLIAFVSFLNYDNESNSVTGAATGLEGITGYATNPYEEDSEFKFFGEGGVAYFDFFDPSIKNVDGFRINLRNGQVTKDGKPVSLQETQTALWKSGYYLESDQLLIDPRDGTVLELEVTGEKEVSDLISGKKKVKEYGISEKESKLSSKEIVNAWVDSGFIPVIKDEDGKEYLRFPSYETDEEGKTKFAGYEYYSKEELEKTDVVTSKEGTSSLDGDLKISKNLDGEELAKFEDLSRKNSARDAMNRQARQFFRNMLNMILGDVINEQAEAMCRDGEASSEPSEVQGSSPPPGGSSGSSSSSSGSGNCPNPVTTLTAQSTKSQVGSSFTYRSSWTVTACKQDTQYSIYLANSVSDRQEIATGFASLASTRSASKVSTINSDFNSICVLTDDSSVGDSGYVCFDVV